MAGIAAAYGCDADDDQFDFSRLEVELLPEPGAAHCSAMWVPREAAADRHARVGRNFDFSTGTLTELLGGSRRRAKSRLDRVRGSSRPTPTTVRQSIVVALGDLTGCIEGCNEHGLTVAILADDVSMSDPTITLRPTFTRQAGLYEVQLLRYLLDTCATANAAREALYEAKQYDEYAVVHYLVADDDDAFVWERDTHNGEFAVDADRGGLCVTNHLLHGRDHPSDVPADTIDNPSANNSYARQRVLYATLAAADRPDSLWDALESVRAQRSTQDESQPPVRTLWHSQYDITQRQVSFEFYLGDNTDGTPRRSQRQHFELAPAATT